MLFVIILIVLISLSFSQYIPSLISGWVISFVNVLIGSVIIFRAFQTGGKGFFNTVLLSMVVRMFVIAGFVFVLVY
ncbi:MAG: hypothetical protein LH629_12510, partial [Ignavibacteria bacterium]|nr:hypothetical protein [Ignavibacteria bacterium]